MNDMSVSLGESARALRAPEDAPADVSFADRPEAPPARVTTTHEGPIIRVERIEFPERSTAAGAVAPAGFRDVVRHPGAVAVVALREDGKLILVRNRRVAVARWLVEFCAGKLERGEDPARAAARELEEETGYRAGKIEKLGAFFTSPGFADEVMHVFLATRLTPVPQRLEPGEELEVVEMDAPTLAAQIACGAVTDGKTLGAYLLWTLRTGRAGGDA